MNPEEYADYDAVGLAALVSSRAVTPGELLDAALARLKRINPSLNAVNLVLED